MKFPKLISAKPESGFRIRARFADGTGGVLDLRPVIFSGSGEMVLPLRDWAYFRKFRIGQFGGVTWANGYDYCPDSMYLQISGAPARPKNRKK